MQNKLFSDFTTRVSFNLTLTKSQVYYLWAVKQRSVAPIRHPVDGAPQAPKHDIFVPQIRGLIDRGLVIREERPNINGAPTWPYELTEAGEKVYDLLVLAGLITSTQAAEEAA